MIVRQPRDVLPTCNATWPGIILPSPVSKNLPADLHRMHHAVEKKKASALQVAANVGLVRSDV